MSLDVLVDLIQIIFVCFPLFSPISSICSTSILETSETKSQEWMETRLSALEGMCVCVELHGSLSSLV